MNCQSHPSNLLRAVWRECWGRARSETDTWGGFDEAMRNMPQNLARSFRRAPARFRRRHAPAVRRALCLALFARERPQETKLDCALRRYHDQRMREDL
ncbi:MAG: hypothetical protein K9N62_07850 [Verrucomicrobia bacterium]|nr:hypothetical protein [Verrucomicrobiota bacterium]